MQQTPSKRPDDPQVPDYRETSFGSAMKAAREERGWSQRKLAEELSRGHWTIDPSAITRIEKGQRDVRLGEAIRISEVLDLSLDQATMWDLDARTQFLRYVDLMRTAMLQARRQMVLALRYGDAAINGLIGGEEDERALAEMGAASFVELWEDVAASMERVWRTSDPIVGNMQNITGDEDDVRSKERLVAAVLHDLMMSEDRWFREYHKGGEAQDDGVDS